MNNVKKLEASPLKAKLQDVKESINTIVLRAEQQRFNKHSREDERKQEIHETLQEIFAEIKHINACMEGIQKWASEYIGE